MPSYTTPQFLPTKFIRPRLHTPSINRPRLLDLLNRGRHRPVTLVSGPAGSGKSTLLSDWLSRIEIQSAWLSLDPYDDEPRRFLAYLTQAVRTIAPDIPADAAKLLASRREFDIDVFLYNLVLPALHRNSRHAVLVIDDVHFLEHPVAKKTLGTFIQRKPIALHVALTSRSEPDLGLVALKEKAQLNEIRSGDLRFRKDEAFVFYNEVMNLELDASRVAAIESHTEGWIAACQLAALRLKGTDHLSADPVHLVKNTWVEDYLLEEVIQYISPTVREFLLTTSILNRMCDSLCTELMGTNQQSISLRKLEQDNLFVHVLDDEGYWYRYHSVLARFLRDRLENSEPERVSELHRIASLWFATKELYQEAVEHAILSKDERFLSHVLEKHYFHILFSSQLATIRQGLNALDVQLLYERPELALADAWCVFYLDGDPDNLEFCLNRVQSALSNHREPISKEVRFTVDYQLNMLRALYEIQRGNYREAIHIAVRIESNLSHSATMLTVPLNLIIGGSYLSLGDFEKAYAPLNRAEYLGLVSKNYFVALSAIASKSVIQNLHLEINKTRHMCTSALRIAQEEGYSLLPIVGTLHVELGLSYFYQGEYDAAMLELERAIQRYSLTKSNQDVATAYCFLARIKLCLGDADGADQALRDGLEAANQVASLDLVRFVLSYQALLDMQRGHLDKAIKWSRDNPPDEVSSAIYREHIHLVKITVDLLSGAFEHVIEETTVLIQRLRKNGLVLYAVILELIRVVALARRGDIDQAAAELSRTARIAMAQNVKVYFQVWGPEVEWSSSIRGLLQKVNDAEVRGFLASIVGDKPYDSTSSQLASTEASFPSRERKSAGQILTIREIEVLEFISHGMSNREIAKTLYVSLPTIKTHIRNIFRKLEVKNRTGALRVARLRGLCHEESRSPL